MSRSASILESANRRRLELKTGGAASPLTVEQSARDRPAAYSFRERRTFSQVNKPPDAFDSGYSAAGTYSRFPSDRGAPTAYQSKLGLLSGYSILPETRYPERYAADTVYTPPDEAEPVNSTFSDSSGIVASYRERMNSILGRSRDTYKTRVGSEYDGVSRSTSRSHSIDLLDDNEGGSTYCGLDDNSDKASRNGEEVGRYDVGRMDDFAEFVKPSPTVGRSDLLRSTRYNDSPSSSSYIKPIVQNNQHRPRRLSDDNNNNDNVVFYNIFDNYTVIQLETVDPSKEGEELKQQQQPSFSSYPPSSVPPPQKSVLRDDVTKAIFSQDHNVPVDKKRALIKNLEGILDGLQQRIAGLKKDIDVEDISVKRSTSKSDQGKSKVESLTEKEKQCGATCPHAQELHAMKTLHEQLEKKRLRSEDQNVHRTDAEKCASKLETENIRLCTLLKKAQDRLMDNEKGSSSRMPHVDGGEKWILLIKEASQIAHQLPQECRDVRADCCRLQTWMTDEMKKINDLLKNPNGLLVRPTTSKDIKSKEHAKTPLHTVEAKPSHRKPPLAEKTTGTPTKTTNAIKKAPESKRTPVAPPTASKPVAKKTAENAKSFPGDSTGHKAAPKSKTLKSVSGPNDHKISSGSAKVKPLSSSPKNPSSNASDASSVTSEDRINGDTEGEESVDAMEVIVSDVLAAISRLNVEYTDSSDGVSVDGASVDSSNTNSNDGVDPRNAQRLNNDRFDLGEHANAVGGDAAVLHPKRDQSERTSEALRKRRDSNNRAEIKDAIAVMCRLRPIVKDDGGGEPALIQLSAANDGVVSLTYRGRLKTFEVNHVLDSSASQERMFDDTKGFILSCLDGLNVSQFAYGHTSAGKTYTLQGTNNDGLIHRSIGYLFECLEADRDTWDFTVKLGVLELYIDVFRDLLNTDPSNKLDVKQHSDGSISVPGLTHVEINGLPDAIKAFGTAQSNHGNEIGKFQHHSARSHQLTVFTVCRINRDDSTKTVTGKLNFIDLAGSERIEKSTVDSARFKEAQTINKTLTAVGDVIYSLRARSAHVPIRTSKLTHLLQDSLTFNSRIILIVLLSSAERHISETIASLMFAQRVCTIDPPLIMSVARRPSVGTESALTAEALARLNVIASLNARPSGETNPRRGSMSGDKPAFLNSRRPSGQATPADQQTPVITRERRTSVTSSTALPEGPTRPVKPLATAVKPESSKKLTTNPNENATATSRSYPKSPLRH